MKTIVVNIDHPDMVAPRLRLARELASVYGSHILEVHTIPLVGIAAGDLYGGADSIARLQEIYNLDAKNLRALTERELDDSDLPWDWIQHEGDSATSLIEHSKCADIVLVGPTNPPDFNGVLPLPVASTVALHACAPVLIVPLNPRPYVAKAPIVVGWNGSAEATHAVKMSLPLLQRADRVWLVYVHEETDTEIPGLDVEQYLSRHGVKVQVTREAPTGSVADTLQNLAQRHGASMIVAGAYGRPRLVETIFGGVSRALLKNPTIPIAMAH